MPLGIIPRGLCLCLSLVTTAVSAQTPDPGQQSFVTRCARCHGTDGNGGEFGPSITSRAPARTDADLIALVRDGLPTAGATTRPRDRGLSDTPATYGAEFKDVEYQTADGVTISAWLLPSRDKRATIIYSHGLFRSRRELLERAVDRPLDNAEAAWAADLWFESEGLPLRFVQAGALLRHRDARRAEGCDTSQPTSAAMAATSAIRIAASPGM